MYNTKKERNEIDANCKGCPHKIRSENGFLYCRLNYVKTVCIDDIPEGLAYKNNPSLWD